MVCEGETLECRLEGWRNHLHNNPEAEQTKTSCLRLHRVHAGAVGANMVMGLTGCSRIWLRRVPWRSEAKRLLKGDLNHNRERTLAPRTQI